MTRSAKPSWRPRAAAGFSANMPSATATPTPAWCSTRWRGSRKLWPRRSSRAAPDNRARRKRWPRSEARSMRPRAAASAALDGLALEQALAPVRKGARVIREISWRLREIGADGRICDLIDSQVSAIEAGCGQARSADPQRRLERGVRSDRRSGSRRLTTARTQPKPRRSAEDTVAVTLTARHRLKRLPPAVRASRCRGRRCGEPRCRPWKPKRRRRRPMPRASGRCSEREVADVPAEAAAEAPMTRRLHRTWLRSRCRVAIRREHPMTQPMSTTFRRRSLRLIHAEATPSRFGR